MPHLPPAIRARAVFVGAFVVIAVVLLGIQALAIAEPSPHHSLHRSAAVDLFKIDSDSDGLSNGAETSRFRTDPRKADTDGDGLSDGIEVNRTKTNPRKADTDGDGVSDGREILAGSNPRNRASVPGRGGKGPHVPTPRPPASTPSHPSADTTAPNTSITSGPTGKTTSKTASFSFAASESGSTFSCKLDAGAFGACSSPKAYSGLAVGSHTFTVRATDAAGNTDLSAATRSWSVEATPPAVIPANAVWDTPKEVEVDVPVVLDGSASTGSGPITCTWSFENQDGSTVWQTRTGCVIDFTFEATGPKYVKLIVEGNNGQTDTDKQSFVVTPPENEPPPVDTTPPDTTISSSPPATTTSTSASFSFAASESGSTFSCKLDAGAFGACSSPKAYSGLAVGSHTFTVRATDAAGNTDLSAATRSWTVEAPTTPPVDTTPPDTTISSSPPATTTSTSASFSFAASESGSTFSCKLDAGAFGACSSPKAYSGLAVGSHTFTVRATDAAGNTDLSAATRSWTVEAPTTPPVETGGCVAGSTNATTASAVKSAVTAGKNVCVTATVGDVSLSDLGKKAVTIATEGGSMGHVEIDETTDLTIDNARFTSVTLRGADRTTIENSTIGGTQANRVEDQLIFIPEEANDVTIRNNDIGWTKADDSGNTGYGCRCYGETNNLKFVGNDVHDIAADGFQGTNGANVLIDRNEIGPVGANPGSSEHSDNIQIVGNGPNLRITNNWIHNQGYYEGKVTGNSGSTYIHGGTANSVLYENNLVETNQGRTEICGLGTGGTSRSNITIRRNTWVEGGLTFTDFPGFEWDCDSGTGNSVERNIAIDPDGGFAQDGSASAATFTSNLWGKPSLVTLNALGNCTSANCNPSGQEPIGYRKPSGVNW